jgi:hypothetical protein
MTSRCARAGLVGLLVFAAAVTFQRDGMAGTERGRSAERTGSFAGLGAFEYLSATLAGYIPADRESLIASLVDNGLRFETRGATSGWVWSDSTGITSVDTMLPAARMVVIAFIPRRMIPIPTSVLGVLQSKAKAIQVGSPSPGELTLIFVQDGLYGDPENSWTSIRDEMYIRIQDGAWMETDRSIIWKGLKRQ